jgi:hypothetical protein
MRPGNKMMAAILFCGAVSTGALAATDETTAPMPGPSGKTSTDIAKEPAPPPSVTVIGAYDARGILGRDVKSAAGENMGRIVDVIVDRSGRVRAAVIDFGGFLGVGSRKIAVDWSALSFDRDTGKRDVVTLELTRDQVKTAPEYKDRQSVVVLGAGGLQSMPDW